jgi:DNA-binding transcriptional LysR family regulator
MDTDQLLAFERIVREGSFSRAARTLDITQPTISVRIQTLEEAVGGALFVRGGRQATLTERGESFLPYARRALEVLKEGVEVAQLTQEGKRGRITLGTVESMAANFLTSTIVSFHKNHPDVEIFVRTGHSEQVEQLLYDGVVKLGLITWPFSNPDLISLLRFREQLIFVAPPQHPLAGRGPVTAEDIHLQASPLLVVKWGLAMNTLLAKILPHTERVMEVPISTVRSLLLQGVGAAFLTRTLVAEELAAGRIVEIEVSDLPQVFRESALVRLARTSVQTAAATEFIRTLQLETARFCVVERDFG